MSTISKTGTAVSAVKTAAAVMALTLFASVAGFVVPAGTSPAAAQDTTHCVTTTVTHPNGLSSTGTNCVVVGTPTNLQGTLTPDRIWCASWFGHYFNGSTHKDIDIPRARFELAFNVGSGTEYIPGTCTKRSTPVSNGCFIHQGGEWSYSEDGDYRPIRHENGILKDFPKGRFADYPWAGRNCLTGSHTIPYTDVLESVKNDLCTGDGAVPEFVYYRAVNVLSNALLTRLPHNPQRLDGPVEDSADCCPNRGEHYDAGDPTKKCHPHPHQPCQTGTTVTYDRIDGDSHTPHTVAPCPPTSTAVGATFDIVLDYPRRGHGVFATIGGALKPVTFTATAENFVCRAPSPCGDPAAGRTVPTSVSFDLDLEGLHGYLEGRDDQFEEFSETFDGYSNGVDRWGRLDYSRQLVAYFYRATYTGDGTSANPAQRVAINVTDLNGNTDITGRYRYSVFETFEEWVDDPGHPDGGYPKSVTETRRYSAPMTARLVDVDGDLITADTDPYYNSVSGRIELRIAGFQPVFD